MEAGIAEIHLPWPKTQTRLRRTTPFEPGYPATPRPSPSEDLGRGVTHILVARRLPNCWDMFRPPARIVSGWNTPRGANAPGALAPVQQLMSDGSVREVRI
jgi:hypothetical protein